MTTPKRKRPTRRAAVKAAPAKPTATIVSNGDDWEGLYINGALVAEDHRLDLHVILTALGVSIARVDVSGDWLGGEVSGLPALLADVPESAICETY